MLVVCDIHVEVRWKAFASCKLVSEKLFTSFA